MKKNLIYFLNTKDVNHSALYYYASTGVLQTWVRLYTEFPLLLTVLIFKNKKFEETNKQRYVE
jgi:hypothetical protein